MMPHFVGGRIKALRQERKLSQGDLARLLGFKDRQTVSAIETGKRHVSAEELLVAVDKLGASLDYFTDPFRLAGEGKFSWRRSNAAQQVDAIERRAAGWIAAYRTLAPQVGRPPSYLRPALRLASQSRCEDAMEAGERFAADFAIGALPAEYLADIMERKLGMLVLMVDRIDGVSAAACRLPDLDAVLINRHETRGRRHLDLAHELFHLLTWDAMPPARVEEASASNRSRVEQLANAFACAVAMPAAAIDRFGPWDGDLVARLNTAADALHVTAMALKWRLIALGRLDPSAARAIPDHALRDGAEGLEGEPPPLFSRPFVEVIAGAIDAGHVSARAAADLLDMSVDDLAHLCATYGLETPYDL